ncbi:hypothetical protein M4D81_29370 [Paenibacillus sp. p3-SID867]|uniref:hypothetical protein n=1 Tax=Paenibacillus sp. p3-SID867 TaxID=2916363 RepID=UPI0021A38FE7|nr:hypothetical protein [Paenibacillus sp. p3-SID867]MCT1403109.1 hypothetical protein [Paenibacillus sp. p3-SID867]
MEGDFYIQGHRMRSGSLKRSRETIWQLDHRLKCGDATSAEDVGRMKDGVKAALVVTDPA